MTYDVIVIGAGSGGLVSSILLQKAGKKVLLLEKNLNSGGYANSFIRGRFEFDTSFQSFINFGDEIVHSELYDLFSRLGLLEKLKFHQVLESYHVQTLDGKEEYTLPFSVPEFILKMEEYVPGCSSSMHDFFELASEVKEGFQYIQEHKIDLDYQVLEQTYPNFMKVSSYSVDVVLNALHMPKKAQEILTSFWFYFGSPTNTLSFVHFALMLHSSIKNGVWVSSLGSYEISSLLVEEFLALGGEVKNMSSVTKILFEGEEIAGVLVNDKKYFAKHIISDISPHKFYGDLIDSEHRTEKMKQLCNARVFGGKGITVYLGLNASMEELGLKHYHYFLYHSLNSNKEYQKMDTLYPESCVGTVLNYANPNCSPSGTTILELNSFYPGERFSKDVTKDNYFEVKNKIAETLISSFEKATGITIRSFIEEIEIATPVTFARYGGHPEGSIFGYMAKGYDNLLPRLMGEDQENYLKNVHFCGRFGSRLSLFGSDYISGEKAAYATLEDMKGESFNEN